MKTKFLLFVSMLSIAFFISCSSNETVDVTATSKTISADDAVVNSEIDASVDDVSVIVEDQFSIEQSAGAKTSAPIKRMLPPCASVTRDLANDIYTKTIDFGTVGCAMPNGNILKGKIIISFSKNSTTPTKTISYTLEGFYHNGSLIEGSKTITRELEKSDLLADIHPITTHAIELKITKSYGKVYTRIGTRVREMVGGFETIGDWEDNVFKVWGSNITTFPNGSKYSSTIKTPLLITASCKMPFPVNGIVDINKNDVLATLDYGNGECDNLATMTTNGESKVIELKKKKM
jgi:hypothetical protein